MRTRTRLNLLVFLSIASVIFTTAFLLIFTSQSINSIFVNHINERKQVEIAEEKEILKKKITGVIKYLNLIDGKYKGDINTQKEETIKYINLMQESNRYIFVLDQIDLNSKKSLGKMIVNPNRKELIGKFIDIDFDDKMGKKIFFEIQEKLTKSDDGYISYHCQKNEIQNNMKKIVYFKYEKRFNWIIAAGFFLNDLENSHKEEKIHFIDSIEKDILKEVMIMLSILIPLTIIIGIILQRIKKRIQEKDQNLIYSNDVYGLLNTLQSNLIKLSTLTGFGNLFYLIVKKLDVDRFYIFQNHEKDGKTTVSQIYEYNRGTATPQENNPQLQDVEHDYIGIKRWIEVLKNGEVIEGNVKDFPKAEKEILQAQDIKSILAMPIFYNNKFWGFIGFDECKKEREWSPVEKFVLKTIANAYTSVLIKDDYTSKLKKNVDEKILEIEQKDKIILQQAKLAAMGEMIGNIAHQWRQPINNLSVLNMTLNQKFLKGDLDTEYMNIFQTKSNKLIQKMSTTIDDFRNFFSPNKSKEEFMIKDAVENAILIVESSLANNFIKITTSNESTYKIYSYKNELEQVILNIISNSKDALNSSKNDDKKIDIYTTEDEDFIIIEIIDNGGGIEDAILPKIFEPYFSTKFQSQGTGIGLYMSRVIIEEHVKGAIQIENYKDGVKAKIFIPKGEK